jgi:phytoene synthase
MPTRGEPGGLRELVRLYTPTPSQRAFTLLCEIEATIGESLRPGIDHQVAHTRLTWWRDECARCARGESQHPATRELTQLFAARGLPPPSTLDGFVAAATWDLAAATCETRAELTGYCQRWAAAMLNPLLALGGAATSDGRELGAALREIELLAQLTADARQGRLRVPLEELRKAQVEPRQLAQPPWLTPLAQLLAERQQALRRQLADSVAALPTARQPGLRGLLVWATLAAQLSSRAERALPQALSPGEDHGPLDGLRAWRAARQADRARFVLP